MTDPAGPGWRADVRDRIVEILKRDVPAVEGKVYRARVWPTQGENKPGLLVYGYFETKEAVTQGGFQHQFNVTSSFVVQVKTEGTNSQRQEAQCEVILGQVERAVLQAPELWSPQDGVLERCTGVKTQITAEQKEQQVEVEAVIEFQMVWAEVFTMAEPDTSECADATLALRDPSIRDPSIP